MSERPHGFARARLDGCHCYVCGIAVSQYRERREKMLAAGKPFVPADAAREHVLLLAEMGFSSPQVARLAGVDRTLIRDIARGFRIDSERGQRPVRRIRMEKAAAILAVPTEALTVVRAERKGERDG